MNKEDLQIIEAKIETAIAEDQGTNARKQESQQLSIGTLKNYFQRKYPNDSEEQIMVKTLDHMKNQFFNTFQIRRGTENYDKMDTSSQGSINAFDYIAGESQAEEDEDLKLKNFWGALISSME